MYTQSQYQKEYDEIMEVYNEAMAELKKPSNIAIFIITLIIGLIILPIVLRRFRAYYFVRFGLKGVYGVMAFPLAIPISYFNKYRNAVKHKNRRLKSLNEKRDEAISNCLFDEDN